MTYVHKLSRKPAGRKLHQSTVCLGDQIKNTYSTTHTESFSGRGCDGQPLTYLLKEPCYPSQHYGSVDLSNIPTGSSYTSTHSRDVYSPKDVLPQSVLRSLRTRNWTRNSEGLAMREITNPPEATHYRSCYHTEHCRPVTNTQPTQASGQPTYWHQHNILTDTLNIEWGQIDPKDNRRVNPTAHHTGEERGPAGPGKPRREPRDRQLWAARRWETDCTALRLY